MSTVQLLETRLLRKMASAPAEMNGGDGTSDSIYKRCRRIRSTETINEIVRFLENHTEVRSSQALLKRLEDSKRMVRATPLEQEQIGQVVRLPFETFLDIVYPILKESWGPAVMEEALASCKALGLELEPSADDQAASQLGQASYLQALQQGAASASALQQHQFHQQLLAAAAAAQQQSGPGAMPGVIGSPSAFDEDDANGRISKRRAKKQRTEIHFSLEQATNYCLQRAKRIETMLGRCEWLVTPDDTNVPKFKCVMCHKFISLKSSDGGLDLKNVRDHGISEKHRAHFQSIDGAGAQAVDAGDSQRQPQLGEDGQAIGSSSMIPTMVGLLPNGTLVRGSSVLSPNLVGPSAAAAALAAAQYHQQLQQQQQSQGQTAGQAGAGAAGMTTHLHPHYAAHHAQAAVAAVAAHHQQQVAAQVVAAAAAQAAQAAAAQAAAAQHAALQAAVVHQPQVQEPKPLTQMEEAASSDAADVEVPAPVV